MTQKLLLAASLVLALTAAQSSVAALPSTATSAWETLNKGLVAGDSEHRKQAIAALGTLGDVPEAVSPIEKALQDKDALVRQVAAATLGDMHAVDAIPYLKTALDDNAEVSFTAAKALWDLGDTSGRWIFQQVLEGERKDAPGPMKEAIRKAKHKLHSPSQLALMGAKEATGQFLGPASMSINVAQQVMKDGGAAGRTAAVGILAKDSDPYALTLLEWALGDKSWAVRAAVAKALGERGNHDTVPKLMPLLSDEHHLVRFMAAASIVKLSRQ